MPVDVPPTVSGETRRSQSPAPTLSIDPVPPPPPVDTTPSATDDHDDEKEEDLEGARLASESLPAPGPALPSHELHALALPSQGNIYTLCQLPCQDDAAGAAAAASHSDSLAEPHRVQLVMATLNRAVYTLEYKLRDADTDADAVDSQPKNPPASRPWPWAPKELMNVSEATSIWALNAFCQEHHFTYLPSTANIISMDAFSRKNRDRDLVIGITIIKLPTAQVPACHYLNVYADWEDQDPSTVEDLTKSCLSIELHFTPYHLTHCEVPTRNPRLPFAAEDVFLLSGSDRKIHLFIEDRLRHQYVEVDTDEFFPELAIELPSIVQWIDVMYVGGPFYRRRLIALGCECGKVLLSLADMGDTPPPVILRHWHAVVGARGGPVSRVQLFRPDSARDKLPQHFGGRPEGDGDGDGDEEKILLLVTSTLTPSVVFSDVLNCGLSQKHLLPSSDTYDVTSCGVVADVDLDGRPEIVLGTFGQMILVYKQSQELLDWELIWVRLMNNPVLAVTYCDLTGDGLSELVVMTSRGVTVLQHHVDYIKEQRQQRMKALLAELAE